MALALPALADGVKTYATEDSFEYAAFAHETAIVGRDLVIDYGSHTGGMLARTNAWFTFSFSRTPMFRICSVGSIKVRPIY